MLKVYGDLTSGNCYKVKLLMALLAIDHEWVPVSALAGETRDPAFLAKNPAGKIPLLEIEQDLYLPESNAILWYLAEGTTFVPEDRLQRAHMLQWMFFEQYSHEPYIAVSRFIIKFQQAAATEAERLVGLKVKGEAALSVMEQHLNGRDFFVGGQPSLADITLYAYTHVAHQGGFDLAPYPAIQGWITRVAALPGYVPMTES
jgi:glutathione S-transferase